MLKIYNTLERKKEVFRPREEMRVQAFCCGPTLYNYIHIGNAKTFTQFDLIIRYLRYKGYTVQYVQNLTDVDDKIIRRAEDEKKDWKTIAQTYEEAFFQDMRHLGVTAVSKTARATDYILEIVSQVQRLVEKKHAYKIADGYYFDLASDPDYGKLAKRTMEEADDAVSRIDENTGKKNKGDFCLWKFSKPGEPVWDTALGKGRPGWHVEDTAITEKEFGEQYDLHGGGMDLVFPHHEAEIAQMESLSGKKPFVRYWMHVAFLQVNKRKMSKSSENFQFLRDILKVYEPRVIRYLFVSTHYRTPLDFSEDSLLQSKQALQRIDDFIRNVKHYAGTGKDHADLPKIITTTQKKIERAMDDDIESPSAFAVFYSFIKQVYPLIQEKRLSLSDAQSILTFVKKIDTIFGVLLHEETIPEEIQALVQEREHARTIKNWKEADHLREKLKEKGYTVDDRAQGPIVKRFI